MTGFTIAACTRRIAQLAGPYAAKGVQSNATGEAEVLPNGLYRHRFQVTIEYKGQKRTALVTCTVTEQGKVVSVE